MAEIKNDTGATRDDAFRRMQETSDKREVESERRHKTEVHELREQRKEDIEKLTRSFDDRLGKERDANRERLTESEASHLKAIDDLRALYAKQRERDARTAAVERATAAERAEDKRKRES